MSVVSKIIGALILSGSVYALAKANEKPKPEKKLSIVLGKMNLPTLEKGSLVLSVNVNCDNPTTHIIGVKKPYLVAYLKGEEVGNSIKSEEYTPIKKEDVTVITGLKIKIPFKKLGSYAVSLISGTIPHMGIEIQMITYVEGTSVPFTERKLFEI